MNVYFVKASRGFDVLTACHMAAENPKSAIDTLQALTTRDAKIYADMFKHQRDMTNCEWKATKSKTSIDNAMNYDRRSKHVYTADEFRKQTENK